MVNLTDASIESEIRISSQEANHELEPEDSSSDEQQSPIHSYAQHYLVFDEARLKPAYRVNFHLDERGPTKINVVSTSKRITAALDNEVSRTQAVKDRCNREGH